MLESRKERIKYVIDYIEKNLEREMSLDEIAKNAGYSKFHLNRIFMEETGMTIHRYLQERRLTIAAEKLVKTEDSIVRIAYEAGYHSQQAFSLAFKQMYLYPPKVYRQMGIFVPRRDRISMSGDFYGAVYGVVWGKCLSWKVLTGGRAYGNSNHEKEEMAA